MSGRMEEVSGSRFSSPVNAATRSRFQSAVHAAYVIAALDVTWMFLQFSITPYLARKLGLDTMWFGYLQSMVGVVQLLGGPVFGRFGDIFGARAALSLASCQMVLSDLSEPDTRADALSKLGLCFGIGMIAGSTIGGSLSTRYGESVTACFGAAGSFISLLLVLKLIPKTTKTAGIHSDAGEKKSQSVFSVREIIRLMTFPRVTRTFVVKIVAGLPSGIFQVMFSIIAINFFKLLPEQNGYLMAYFGIVQMVIQGGVIGRLTARFSEDSLLLLSVGVSVLTGLAQASMQNVFQFCFIVVPMMFSLSMFNVITDSVLTKSVPSSDTGTMLGLCASVQSLLRTIGPTIGSFLYVNHGVSSFGLIQAAVNVVVFVYLLQHQFKKKTQ
ncbi:hypothetical protein LDENG_00193420 [Lucifuga dentata]|nr:hypothetical protein LDENG_00193420 [Lucifuga dentata]